MQLDAFAKADLEAERQRLKLEPGAARRDTGVQPGREVLAEGVRRRHEAHVDLVREPDQERVAVRARPGAVVLHQWVVLAARDDLVRDARAFFSVEALVHLGGAFPALVVEDLRLAHQLQADVVDVVPLGTVPAVRVVEVDPQVFGEARVPRDPVAHRQPYRFDHHDGLLLAQRRGWRGTARQQGGDQDPSSSHPEHGS